MKPKPPEFRYNVTSSRLVDGDTIDLVIDLGFSVSISQSCRILGIDAPEHTTNAGLLVKAVMAKWIASAGQLQVISIQYDKFGGRFDGQVFSAAGYDWATYLLDNKLARPYSGEKKPPWTHAELSTIEKLAQAIINP